MSPNQEVETSSAHIPKLKVRPLLIGSDTNNINWHSLLFLFPPFAG